MRISNKTLLKNYHQLFEIVNKDKVRIKIYKPNNNNDNTKQYLKTKVCMFELFHPNGCYQQDSECSFIHKNTINKQIN